MEQRPQQRRRKVHVPGYEDFLFECTAQRIRVHENSGSIIPGLDLKTIQSRLTCTGRVYLPQDALHHLGAPPSQYFGKQVTMQKTSPTQIL